MEGGYVHGFPTQCLPRIVWWTSAEKVAGGMGGRWEGRGRTRDEAVGQAPDTRPPPPRSFAAGKAVRVCCRRGGSLPPPLPPPSPSPPALDPSIAPSPAPPAPLTLPPCLASGEAACVPV